MEARFCMRCGRPLNADGRCPYCSKGASPARGPQKAPANKKRHTLAIVLVAVNALLLGVLAVFLLIHFGVIPNPFRKDAGDERQSIYEFEHKPTPPEFISNTELARPDTRTMLEEAGTIVSETRLSASQTAQTEAEAYRDLADRGFTQAPITTSYAADGSYTEEKEISAQSGERHPTYQTLYMTGDGVIWSILSINGSVTANPLSFNDGEHWDVMHLLSETGLCVQYDSAATTFFEILPDPSALRVKPVSRIDAALLESMTAEEVDR